MPPRRKSSTYIQLHNSPQPVTCSHSASAPTHSEQLSTNTDTHTFQNHSIQSAHSSDQGLDNNRTHTLKVPMNNTQNLHSLQYVHLKPQSLQQATLHFHKLHYLRAKTVFVILEYISNILILQFQLKRIKKALWL